MQTTIEGDPKKEERSEEDRAEKERLGRRLNGIRPSAAS